MIAQRYALDTSIKRCITIMTILLTIGLIFIYSSSSIFALERYGSAYFFLKKQLLGIGLGTCGFLLFQTIPLSIIKKLTPIFFWTSWMLTVATLIPGIGTSIHGSSRWLSIGSFSFQPSDLLKLSFIMFIARFIEKKEQFPFSFKRTVGTLLIVLGLLA